MRVLYSWDIEQLMIFDVSPKRVKKVAMKAIKSSLKRQNMLIAFKQLAAS